MYNDKVNDADLLQDDVLEFEKDINQIRSNMKLEDIQKEDL